MSWNPERYLAFGDQRTRPAIDLLARVPLEAPARLVDPDPTARGSTC